MEEDETVLSDVHISYADCDRVVIGNVNYSTSCIKDLSVKIVRSRFPFQRVANVVNENLDETKEVLMMSALGQLDDDGDLVVKRRSKMDVILLEHGLNSPLNLVGLQVWLGALMMCDYILNIGDTLVDNTVLELGAGTGLCSIVSSIFAKQVICTDVGHDVLKICENNSYKNRHLARENRPILVKELDWRKGLPPPSWSSDELHAIDNCNVILAADVIYDDEATDSLFEILSKLLVGRPDRRFYLSIERRLNFTISDLDVSCPAYDHFIEHVNRLRTFGIAIERLSTDFHQRFIYEKSKYLELWASGVDHSF